MRTSHRSLAPALLFSFIPALAFAQNVSPAGHARAGSSSLPAGAEVAYRALLQRSDDAWNARDAGRFTGFFTPDVNFAIEGVNVHVLGRDSLRRRYTSSFATMAPDLRQRTTLEDLHPVAPDVVVADIRVVTERLGVDSSRTPVRSYTGSLVSVRDASGWHTRVVRLRLLPPDSASSLATARRQTDQANVQWASAFNSGDIATSARVYAADAMLLPPNSAAISGRAAIQKYWQGGWGAGVRNVKLTTDELTVTGDMATEVGRYQFDVQSASGVAGGDHGKYVVIWKRSPAEGWQWYRDIFNSDVPASPTK